MQRAAHSKVNPKVQCLMHCYLIVCVCLCRDAVNDLALHFLAKMKIMVVRDIEREDIEFVSRVRRGVSLNISWCH